MREEALFESPEPLRLPPLMHGEELSTGDPFTKACARAMLGCDSGLITWQITPEKLRAALVLAPETPLAQAMAALPACAVGFQNALGFLAPPEVAVFLGWDGAIWVNGARAGRLRVAAATSDPDRVPNWLVVGLEAQLIPRGDEEGGLDTTRTSLAEEGCGDVEPLRLLEGWARHTLVWLSHLEGDGPAMLHREWRGVAHGLGQDVTLELGTGSRTGVFMGMDEDFGALLRVGNDTSLIPLTALLEATP